MILNRNATTIQNANSNSLHVEKIRIALLDSLFGLLDGFEIQLSEWRDHTKENTDRDPAWVPDVTFDRLKSILPEHKMKFGQFVASECETFVDITKLKDYRDMVL